MRRLARALLYAGVLLAVVGLSAYHANEIANPPYSYTGTFRFGWSLLYAAILAVTAYGFGLPDVPRTQRQALVASVAAPLCGALGISALQLLAGDALLPRFVVLGAAVVLIPWYLVCVVLSGEAVGARGDRVLVVADGIDPALLRSDVARAPERPAMIIEVVPVAGAGGGGADDGALAQRALRDRATVVVLDRSAQECSTVVAQAAALHEAGIRVRTLQLFYEEWLGMLPLSELERVSLLFDIGELHRSRYGRIKRLLDLALALVGLAILIALVPLVWIGNLVANRGRLFYRQVRVGKGGATFEILKFRTMVGPSDDHPTTEWTAPDDPRVTPFGGLLRRTHLDELPQVINILRGDLAVVGPRPEQPRYVAELVEALPFYDLRHLVRPGLTGWAQVKYGYAGDERDALAKLQYEFYYLRHQSLGLDLRIMGRTVRSILGLEGR